jgi:vacuolar-type H+-ATPase subunit I/STV1
MAAEDEGGIPPWVKYLSDEMNRRFDAFTTELRALVSRDSFRDEQTRVNAELHRLRQAQTETAQKLESEAQARASAELAAANKATAEADKRETVRKQTNWQWLAIFAFPVIGWILDWIRTGGLAP